MKIATLLLNWLIVCAGCFTGYLAIALLLNWNRYEMFEGKSLPPISQFCLQNDWLLWVVPLTWGIATIVFYFRNNTPEKTNLHTSASVFLGLLVFFSFLAAGLLPFLNIFVMLGN